ncbi:MAG: T9SS type A sorting domain-containing protein [Bacteroidota bacterium]
MRKLYTKLLLAIALMLTGTAYAQVTNITVSDATPCAGSQVTVSWNIGSGGGGQYAIKVSTIAPGGMDVSFGTQPGNDFLFTPVIPGTTYYVTVTGNDGIGTNAPAIVVNTASAAPTGFTINGDTTNMLCNGAPAKTLAVYGGNPGSMGILRAYNNSNATGPSVVYPSGSTTVTIPGQNTTINRYVRYESECDTSAVFHVQFTTYTNASAAATNVALNGTPYTTAVCPGTYTLSALGGSAGNNPNTDTLFFSNPGFTTQITNPYTIGSNFSGNVYVRYDDGCSAANDRNSGAIAIASTVSSVDAGVLNTSVGSACAGTSVTFTTDGSEVRGAGFVAYQYSTDGASWFTASTNIGTGSVTLLMPSTDLSVTIRMIDACDTTDGVSATITVIDPSTPIDSVGVSDTQVCSGTNVTFTAYGGVLEANGYYEYNNGVNGWINIGSDDFITLNITSPTSVSFRITDDCSTTGSVASTTVDIATDNIAPTGLTVSNGSPCPGDVVDFTATGGTLSDLIANNDTAYYEFSTDAGFGTVVQASTSNVYSATISSATTIYARINGGCGAPTASVNGSATPLDASVTPTGLDLYDQNNNLVASTDSLCAQNVTLTATGGSLGTDGALYEFGYIDGNGFNTLSTQSSSSLNFYASGDITFAVRLVGGSGCVSTPTTPVTVVMNGAISGIAATQVTITDENNTTIANGDAVCGTGTYTFTSDATLGTNEDFFFTVTYQPSGTVIGPFNNDTSASISVDLSLVPAGTTSIDVSSYTDGGCNGMSSTVMTTLNLFGASNQFFAISADADNFCANSGTTVNITAIGGAGPSNANAVWYELDQQNNIVGTAVATQPLTFANVLTVSPTKTTTYGVRVEGCDTTAFVVHTVFVKDTAIAPTAISVSPSATVCDGSTISLTANGGTLGASPASYEWYNVTTNTVIGTSNPVFFNVSGDAAIQVRIIGACNTTVYSPVQNITVYNAASVAVNDAATCPNSLIDLNTLVTAGTGGTFAGTGVAGHNFVNATPGVYAIAYTKSFGNCAFTDTFNITVFDAPSVTADNIVSASCNTNNGAFDLTATGGTSGSSTYTFNVAGSVYPGFSSPFGVTGLNSGSYTVFVTDDNSCKSADIIVVVPNISGLTASYTQTDVSCSGGNNGSITVTTSGGQSPFDFQLSTDNVSFGPAQSSGTFSNLAPGSYFVRVTDITSCTFTINAVITQPIGGAIDLTVDNYKPVTCFGEANGEINGLTVSGGTAPFAFSVDGTNFQTENAFTGLVAGSYVITVQDNNGCTAEFSFNINTPSQITADVVIDAYDETNGYDVTIDVDGGTTELAALQISLNGGAFQSSETFTGLQPGEYTYTVKDDNGCSITGDFTLTDPSSVGSVAGGLEVSVYPNPFAGVLSIKGQLPADAVVTLVDVYGKAVNAQLTNNGAVTVINTESLAKGMYILNIKANGINVSKKVIKN